MKIGIILGSVRDNRFGEGVVTWVAERAARRGDAEFVALDLKTFNLPLLTSATLPGMANKQYDDAAVTAWSQAVDGCDAYVFVTAEYNHSVPGAFKNAFDSLGSEWSGKVVAFVSYGADGGIRAVEHWRSIVSNFQMVDVRNQVSLSLFADTADNGFAPTERRDGELDRMLDDLVKLTARLSD